MHSALQAGYLNGYPDGMATDPDWRAGWLIAPFATPPGWATIGHPDMPKGLHLSVKIAPTVDGLAVSAVLIERVDGRAITARDLRIKLPPAWLLAAGRPSSLPGSPVIAAARPGARGKSDDHWRAVFDLWARAQRVAPRAPVRWMRTQWPRDVSDATMRRWTKRARERAEVRGWKEEDQR